jgi:nucleoside-triphosphatase
VTVETRRREPALLLTGEPGVGKTTVLRRVASGIEPGRVGGFLTDEVRKQGRRVGFRLVPFRGPERILAHVGLRGPARVGRYGVDVDAIDAIVETALALDPELEIYLVDEIGKMECFSGRFVTAVQGLLESDRRLIATVAQRGGGLIADVKHRPDVEIWEVTRANREELPERIQTRLGLA